MAKKGLSITLSKDWNKFHAWVNAFDGTLQVAARKAVKRATLFVLAEVIKRIENRDYKKLSPLTLFVRQTEGFSDVPLKRQGGLVRVIATDVENAFVGHVGLLKQGKGRSKTDFSNIGELLHDGGRIKVTDAMRRAFMRHLGRQMQKKGVKLLNRRGSKKGIIRIPPRPFIKSVFEDPLVAARVEAMYFEALRVQTGM